MPILRTSQGRFASNGLATARLGQTVKVTGRVRGRGLIGKVTGSDSSKSFALVTSGSGKTRSDHVIDLSGLKTRAAPTKRPASRARSNGVRRFGADPAYARLAQARDVKYERASARDACRTR